MAKDPTLVKVREDILRQTAVFLSAQQGHEDVTMFLIEAGSLLTTSDINSWTPMSHALFRGHTALAHKMFQAAAEVGAAYK